MTTESVDISERWRNQARLLRPIEHDDCCICSQLTLLGFQVVEQLPWWVAPIVFLSPLHVWEVERLYGLR